MKKLACLLLVLALMCPTAAAAPLEITGEVAAPDIPTAIIEEQPVISVSVPDSGWVVVNPYGLEVARGDVISSEQVVSPPMVLQNQSTVPVQVNAQAMGTVPAGSAAVFVPFAPSPDAAAKETFLFLEFQRFQGVDTPWTRQFTDAPNQLLVTEQGIEKPGLLTLEVGGAGALRVFGAAAANPATPWTAADTVNVTVVFTFTAADGGSIF